MIKVIASDMDGTLLNSRHKICSENIKAIRMAEDKGIKFVIVTGREYESVKPIINANELRCQCILMNGAEYRDEDGNILESININKKRFIQIVDILKNDGGSILLFTNDGIYTTSNKEDAFNAVVKEIQTFEVGVSYEEALEKAKTHPNFTKLKYIEDINKFSESGIEVRKILTFNDDLDKVVERKKQLSDIEDLAVSSSFYNNIEITNVSAQKGIILGKYADNNGIPRDEIMVLGDSFNDYSMFTEFNLSFAMGNAIPEIKEVAKYITDTNDNAGVAKAIYNAIENNL